MQSQKSSPAGVAGLSAEVAIVGGGPVGMGLAIELGQRGIRCVLLERYQDPQRIPKGQNLTQRTMEHFHFWGAEKNLRAARTIPPDYGIGGITVYGSLLGQYSYDWLQRALVQPYYFCKNERLPQYATESVLRTRLAELPSVRFLSGWKVDGVLQDADGVRVSAVDPETGVLHTIAASYAVGCDGSRSTVRANAGITQTLSDHDRMMVLLVFKSRQLHELLKRYPGKSYYCVLHPELGGYWKFFGRVDLGETWFFHAPVPPGTTRENFDFERFLHEAVGSDFDIAFEHIGFWDLRFAVADSYRAGRIFIAGDAAHSHPPYGGYGVNTGFEDARNLGWKLAAALRGWGSDSLLDSYDAERRPVFESTAREFIAKAIEVDRNFLQTHHPERDLAGFEQAWQARADGAAGEVNAFEPNYEGSPIVCGQPASDQRGGRAVGSHMFKARAGHHLAPAALSDGRNIYDALGAGFTLIALDADAQSISALSAVADEEGLPLSLVQDLQQEECARYEARLILVRPDHFVAWAGDRLADADEVRQLLRTLLGTRTVETLSATS